MAETPETDRNQALIERWSAMSPEGMAALDPEGDFAKRHLLNPTVLGMLGDVAGRRVLDAGCGQGYFSRMLAARGASVVGLEPAEGLFRYAQAREAELGQGITFVRADLATGDVAERDGALAEPGTFDAVVANMVLMTIPDWRAALATCVRALRPGGRLVVSITHPCFERLTAGWAASGRYELTEYLAEYVIEEPVAPDFHRPLSAYLTAVAEQGCRIVEVAEPRLAPELVADGGPGAEALTRAPCFLVVAATRDGVTVAPARDDQTESA